MSKGDKKPIGVKIIAETDVPPLELTSHAALKCYQAQSPTLGKVIDVDGRLFSTGHHTTLQHFFSTFDIEDIAVGDITAGIHLVSTFYNTDQRSGRYCAKMFLEPDYEAIRSYIKTFWPGVDESTLADVMSYVAEGVNIFHSNIAKATEVTTQLLKEERPFISGQSLEANAPKIAQEQMRMFISVIFPTGLDFTVNLTALAAIQRSGWTPGVRSFAEKAVGTVLEKHPELAFMFNLGSEQARDWSFPIGHGDSVLFSPKLALLGVDDDKDFVMPRLEDMHPVDLLHFMPEYMNNSVRDINTRVEISLATMGQDQRHRTVRRGQPFFTGNFYLPAVPEKCDLASVALSYVEMWKGLRGRVPETLFMILAPYGAMVSYEKKGSFNAVAHEQGKRLCWCAQEEIYNVGRLMRESIGDHFGSEGSPLLKIFEPPCFRTGKCVEGGRYCGRDLRDRNPDIYFPTRKV